MESLEFFDISKCYSEASEVSHLHKRYLFQERALAGKVLCPFRREGATAMCDLACLFTTRASKWNVGKIPVLVSDGHSGLGVFTQLV